MARAFRDLPIRRKLVLVTLASSVMALLFAAGGFFAWDVMQLRREIDRDVRVLSRTLAENSTASLSFADARAAGETLAVLEIHPNVRAACMYAEDAALFATYFRSSAEGCPGVPNGSVFGWRSARVVTPITLQGRQIGTLLVDRDLDDVIQRIAIGASILSGLLIAATLLAVVVGSRMQRTIADPLLELAKTARAISDTKDYSLRASATSGDEVGVVVEAFNEMLNRVQERNAELARANRLKDEFLATLSHELRTPLNAVLGWVRMLRSTSMPPATYARALETIERNARLQATLIEDLLEVSRIMTGKLRLQLQTVDLAAIVDAAIEVTQPAATAKHIRLVTEVAKRPCLTVADPDRLQQVVWNLLSNAVKFTPAHGRVTARLSCDGEYVLTVTDTGIGIDRAFLPHMFEAFRQADASPSRQQGGLGLGLAIVRQLVELHGGTVTARSDGKDLGTTFEVRLPSVVPADTRLGTPASPPVPPPDPPRRNMLADIHILVVDDEEDARELLRTTFETYGATVTTARSAAEAMRIIARSLPDIIVSDVGMAGEDGYAFIGKIRARPPAAGGKIPAIALTAYASAADRQAALDAGFQAHVAKPFEPSDLAALVLRLAQARQHA